MVWEHELEKQSASPKNNGILKRMPLLDEKHLYKSGATPK
jgi:hypothetical protein